MTEQAIKKRFQRAFKTAIRMLEQTDYKIMRVKDLGIDLEAIRPNEIRFIRICLDKVTKEDYNLMQMLEVPKNCVKEIWFRKRDSRFFIIEKIK